MKPNKDDNTLLEWRVYPFEKELKRGIFGLIVIALFCLAVYYSFRDFFWVGLSILVLSFVVMPFYAPTTVTFTDKGVFSRNFINSKYKSWDSLARWEKGKKGVLLSPFNKRSFLDSYRGIFLAFDDNADEVMNIVKERLGGTERGRKEVN